jgi:DNA-binding LytR/AlgR family response regulator
VLAIKAEQHYIRVFAGDKSYMTLYRFSDALAEMADMPGLQVHRSYWVRPEFIEKIRRGSGKMTVHLRSGMEVPVSGPYKVLVKQMARQAQIPILPITQ